MKPLLLLFTAALLLTSNPVFSEEAAKPAPAASPAKLKPDLVNGETAFSAKACASCHNADGNSAIPANPQLAQQHPEYLLKQLAEFKSGKRKNAIMSGMAATLSDA